MLLSIRWYAPYNFLLKSHILLKFMTSFTSFLVYSRWIHTIFKRKIVIKGQNFPSFINYKFSDDFPTEVESGWLTLSILRKI